MRIRKVDILLVDDRPEGLTALEAVLNVPEYRLIKANSGEEALAKVLTYDFSVILMDVQMPGIDGFEAASLIKQRERSKDIPIIFITAISKDPDYIHRGYVAGAVDYIFKPFDAEILKSKVGVFVELYQKRVQLKEQAELLRQSESRERARQIATLQLESFNRYRHLADAVPHIIWKFDIDEKLEYCNQYWSNFSGRSMEESLGQGWKQSVHDEDLQNLLGLWKQVRDTKEPFTCEIRLRATDGGEFRWHVFRAVPELEISGVIRSWIVTNTDIHDRKKIEEDLRRAKDESIAASEAKTNFLANMSHEIRTPLGAVLGFAELISNPEQTEGERKRCLDTIRRNGELLSQLIGDILDLSKIEAGKIEIEKVKFSLLDLLKAALQSLDHLAKEKGISLQLKLESPIPVHIYTDPTRVRQILFNIIGNAVKFTETGTVLIQVELIGELPNPKISIAVRDQGSGISGAQAQKLFQPFIQADNSTTRKYGGTGLGLSLSRKLAQQLDGNVELTESIPGEGSTFTITLSTGDISQVAFTDTLNVEAPIVSLEERKAPSLSGVKILLVEDSADNQTLITRFLNVAGADVETADNGSEGVTKALSNPYDVILMDIQMPILDGYRATQKLRSLGVRQPIIALTAYALKEERERCLSSGCNDHLTKPINRLDLIQQIAKYTTDLH